jgi:hypothetical protein
MVPSLFDWPYFEDVPSSSLLGSGQNYRNTPRAAGIFPGGKKSPPHHFLRQKKYPPHHSSSAIKLTTPSFYKAKTLSPIILRGRKLAAASFLEEKITSPSF